MEPAPSRACETKGLGRQDLPSGPKIFFFFFFNKAWHLAKQLIPLRSSHPLQR